MQGIEKEYCDVCIGALISSIIYFMEFKASEALNLVPYGKGDTLSFDATPEIIISRRLSEFNRDSLLITEETDDVTSQDWPTDPNPKLQPELFFSDPVDRSKFLKKFIEIATLIEERKFDKIGNLFNKESAIECWEEKVAEKPAIITGATTSITFVRKGKVIFTVMVNFITRDIILACDSGIFRLEIALPGERISGELDLNLVIEKGEKIAFPTTIGSMDPDSSYRFVTFLGKVGYKGNFIDSQVIGDKYEGYLHHSEPGGPSRVLYLSDLHASFSPIGFVLANGEKITEWIHWLPFVKYAKNHLGNPALKIFEISIERPWTKEEILMSTSPPYSIFNSEEQGNHYIDVSRMKNYRKPSRFRSTILVAPADNERIFNIMAKHKYRDISGCL